MRILVINSEYPPIGGGAGNASENIARGLAGFGHQVLVLTARFDALPHLEEHHGVTVQRVAALRRRQDRSDALEQMVFIAAGALRLPGVMRQFRPQATVAFFGMPSGAIAWLLKQRYGIPYIVSLRGGDVPGFRPYDFRVYHKLIGPFLHRIWREAFAVIANSHGLCNMAHAFDPKIEIPIIPNGVDLQRYRPEARAWTPPRLFSVGRVVYQKGFDLGLHALAGLKDLGWQWTIAGDGTQMANLRALAEQLGLSERVHFLGWQSGRDLVEWYHQANMFLFPSRHEGMPNAVLEAMASGLPVVATRIAGNEELVLEGETGYLVPGEDVQALRAALRRLLGDGRLREEMGRAARRRVEEYFGWESVARQYEAVLRSAAPAVEEAVS